tara:strand:- start:269 stop:457 length:189 start_codon:yes stop_codon:yes gene_type:complete
MQHSIEPEQLAARVVAMFTTEDLMTYVLEDLTEYYNDLRWDDQYEYEAEVNRFYDSYEPTPR